MSRVIQDIVNTKLQLITIFEQQITLLRKGMVAPISEFQEQENLLSDRLNNYKEMVKKDKTIVTNCEHEELLHLTQTCIKFQNLLSLRHKLIEDASFINQKILSYLSAAMKENNMPYPTNNSNNSVVINYKA